MAKSKLVKANKKIEKAVTGTYKKIENSVVGAYKNVEDRFVDSFLTKEGENNRRSKKKIIRKKINV